MMIITKVKRDFTQEEYRLVQSALDMPLKKVLKQWKLDVIPVPPPVQEEPQQILDKILKDLLGGVLDPAKVQRYQEKKQKRARYEVRCYHWSLIANIQEEMEYRCCWQWRYDPQRSTSTVEWTSMDLLNYSKRFSCPTQVDSLVRAINQRWSTDAAAGTADLKFEVRYLSAEIITSGTSYIKEYEYHTIGPRTWVGTKTCSTKRTYRYPRDRSRNDPFLAVQALDGPFRIIAAWNEDFQGITPVCCFNNDSDNRHRRGPTPIIPDPNDTKYPEGGYYSWNHYDHYN